MAWTAAQKEEAPQRPSPEARSRVPCRKRVSEHVAVRDLLLFPQWPAVHHWVGVVSMGPESAPCQTPGESPLGVVSLRRLRFALTWLSCAPALFAWFPPPRLAAADATS